MVALDDDASWNAYASPPTAAAALCAAGFTTATAASWYAYESPALAAETGAARTAPSPSWNAYADGGLAPALLLA